MRRTCVLVITVIGMMVPWERVGIQEAGTGISSIIVAQYFVGDLLLRIREENRVKSKNLRRVTMLVTAQTAKNLERLAQMDGQPTIGRVMDKLVREKMLSLRHPEYSRSLSQLGRSERIE